jgi:hypothetical protein
MIFNTPAAVANKLIAIKKQTRQRSTSDRLNFEITNIGITAHTRSPAIPVAVKAHDCGGLKHSPPGTLIGRHWIQVTTAVAIRDAIWKII